MDQGSLSTPLQDYITELLPWAQGHQVKAVTASVAVIMDRPTGRQAALARSFGHQEAAGKRVSRVRHHERLKPKEWAEAVIHQALSQGPGSGRGRFTIDGTSEADPH
jgi:hypothetical protein